MKFQDAYNIGYVKDLNQDDGVRYYDVEYIESVPWPMCAGPFMFEYDTSSLEVIEPVVTRDRQELAWDIRLWGFEKYREDADKMFPLSSILSVV